jgi:hypothetical protein
MNTEPNHDDAIDQVLAALRNASPPEGMEARIASRLACKTAAPSPRSRIAALAPSASWWRGAITGAAVVLLAVGLFFSASHFALTRSRNLKVAATGTRGLRDPTHHAVAANVSAPLGPSRRPCLKDALLPTRSSDKPQPQFVAQNSLNESAAPSRPAPVLPLTPQERQLARLVRTSDPRQLAALSVNEEARLEAERASELSKYFDQRGTAHTADAALAPASPSATDTAPEATPDQAINPTADTATPTQSSDQPSTPATTDQTVTRKEEQE